MISRLSKAGLQTVVSEVYLALWDLHGRLGGQGKNRIDATIDGDSVSLKINLETLLCLAGLFTKFLDSLVRNDYDKYSDSNNLSEEPLRLPTKHCVYVLYNEEKAVYVGMSKNNMFGRIGQHAIDEDKDFDSFTYTEIEEGDALVEEKKMIRKLKPKYNITHNSQ